MRKQPLIIILFGQPGSGKGVQAGLLADKLRLYYLETSKLIESRVMTAKEGEYVKVGAKKYFLTNEKKLWQSGILCSPPFVNFLVKQKIKELFKNKQGIILAGSPRTLIEGKEQIPLLKKTYGLENIKVFFLKISPEETLWRNSRRRICQLMRHSIVSTKETERLTLCPLDGSKLVRREGLDDPETIKVRLKEYKERTLPLIKYFKQEGLKIKNINGEQSIESVFKAILKFIK